MSRRALAVLSLVGILAVVTAPGPAAQGQPSVDLFTPAPAAAADFLSAASARPDTLAARGVGINAEAFAAERLRIDLFGAASVVAERTDVGAPIAGARIWTGTIPGSPLSSVTLAEVGNRVQGSIRTLDATYSIEPAGDDASVLRQVDVAQGRPELPPVEAPIPDAAADLDVPQADSGSTFDLLVVYNQAARSAAGGDADIRALIALGVAEANTAYANSQIIPRLRLVGTEFVSYAQSANMSDDLVRLTETSDGILDAVHTRRDALGADMVQLIVGPQTNACGIGWLMTVLSAGFEGHAFSVSASDCISPNYTLAHELGHNMGSNHAPQDLEPGETALFPYSFGYKHPDGDFRTVMAYDCEAPSCPRVLHFSNPNVLRNGDPTGTSTQNDNARSIDNAWVTVANWRPAAATEPPTISPIGATSTNEDTPSAPIAFTIGDPDTPIANLVVSAFSADAVLVPNTPAALVLAGITANRTLTVTPAANQFGSTTITVNVSDGATTASAAFVLSVAAVNDAPAVSIAPVALPVPQGVPAEATVTVTDIDSPGPTLFLSGTSSNQALVPNAAISITPLSSTAGSRTFRAVMTPVAGTFGSTTLSFVANDFGVAGTTTGTLPLTVLARPAISAIEDVAIQEDASVTVPFTVTDPDTPTSSLSISAASSSTSLVDADGLDLGGSGGSRTLKVTPIANAHGSATITVSVSDGAQSVQRAFVLTVASVNDVPVFHSLTATGITAASGAPTTFYVAVADPDSPPESIVLAGAASNQALVPSVAIVPGASTASARQFAVTLTSAPGSTGSTTVALSASDPQSASATRNITVAVVSTPVAPDPPLNLTGSVSGARITLEWFAAQTGAPPTSYSIELGTSPGATTLPTQSTTAPTTMFETDLPDGLYFVRVRGVNGAGSSTPSAEAVVAVGAAAYLPGPPANFTIDTFRTSATLSWSPSAVGQPASSYIIEAGSAPGFANLARMATTGPVTSFVVPSVPQGTYFVRVRGRNQLGEGAPSQDVSITMGPTGQCVALPDAPVLLTPVVAGNTVSLSWNAAATGGPAESYLIGAGSGPGLSNFALFDTGSSGTSYAATAPSGAYFVRIAAVNPCGVSQPSNEVSFTLGPQLPGAPTGLQASVAANRRVTLTWTPPSSGGMPTAYLLQAGSGPGLSDLAVISTGAPVPAFSVVAPPGTYYVRVRAINGAGLGLPSNEIVVFVP